MSCGDFIAEECVNGVCVQGAQPGTCWRDSDCGPGESCSGEFVCGCAADCNIDKTLGTCVASMGGGGSGSGGASSGCPASAPTDGNPCTLANKTICEYGTDPRPDCRAEATCKGNKWSVSDVACPVLPGPGEMGCPSSTSSGSGTMCSIKNEICDEGGGAFCICGVCVDICPGGPGNDNSTWTCYPPASNGCPAVMPDVGQPCNLPTATECSYGSCGAPIHAGRACKGGVWVNDFGGACPG